MVRRARPLFAAAVVVALAATTGLVADRTTGAAGGRAPQTVWSAAWRSAPQPPTATGASHDGFAAQTLRLIVRPGVSGTQVRVHLSNRYGATPLQIGSAAVGEQDQGATVVAHTQRPVTFAGAAGVAVAPGSEAVSDPVPVRVRAGHNLAVSVYLSAATGPATWHAKAQTTSYVTGPGDWTSEPGGSPFQSITPSWFFLDGVDVLGRAPERTVVAFGDSITDGAYSTLDAAHTYPGWLAGRFPDISVLNEGIGGNQLLAGTAAGGEAGVQRFAVDALAQPGVDTVILLEGVNDIGAGATADEIVAGLMQIIDAAHARHVRVISGTITPFSGSVYDVGDHEQVRQAVNAWIRTSGYPDAVADFDRVLRDPADPLVIAGRYHTVGDLHPNDDGYRAMAAAIPRSALAGPARGGTR